MKLLTDGWWAIISIPIEFTFTFSCCYIAFSFVVTMWIIFTNKFWKYKIKFFILKIRVHSSIELKFDNLLEWYIYMKNKVPEQSSLEDQPGLHKHQLLSLHTPCPLQILFLEHSYSERKEQWQIQLQKNQDESYIHVWSVVFIGICHPLMKKSSIIFPRMKLLSMTQIFSSIV